MRGGRSFLILLVVALGLGAYIYFVESKREPADTAASKKDKVFTADSVEVRGDRGPRGLGRNHDAQEGQRRSGRS